MSLSIEGFTQEIGANLRGCIGVFGKGGTGKTHFAATATEWALERGKIPGWIILDPNTQEVIKKLHEQNGWPIPLMTDKPFVTNKEAIALAMASIEETKKTYTTIVDRIWKSVCTIAASDKIDPIIIDGGTQLYDWISFAHFGRRDSVGVRAWGGPKQDWTDILDAARNQHTVIVTLRTKPGYRNDKPTGQDVPDGPNHLSNTTTSIVQLNFDKNKPVSDYLEKFSLDVFESHDDKGLDGASAILTGIDINFTNLMYKLRPND